MSRILSLTTAAALFFPAVSVAGPLNPWAGPVGKSTIAINPYLYIMPDGEVNPIMYGIFGATDRFDVLTGFGMSFHTATGVNERVTVGSIEVMPRFFVTDNVGFALHAMYTPGEDNAVLGLESHMAWQWGRFAFTANTGWHPVLGGEDGFDPGSWYAILAPEFFVLDQFSLFVEVDPGVDLNDGAFDLTLVPGIGVGLDKEGMHAISVGVQIPFSPTVGGDISAGLWYGTTFDVSRKRSRVTTDELAAASPEPSEG